MVAIKALLVQFFITAALARPNPLPLSPDPAGTKNIGNGAGEQFIGGACLSSKDCASACCATLNGAGICSGVGAQFQSGKTGCGFGDAGAGAGTAEPSTPAESAPVQPSAAPDMRPATSGGSGADTVDTSLPGSQNVGKGDGSQFITGQCFSDADCQSGCCAKPKGVCSAVAVQFAAGKQGCGFSNGGAGAAPSPPAASATTQPSAVPAVMAPESDTDAGARTGGGADGVNASLPGAQNVGKGNGSQFITGQCFSDADCQSGCCAKPAGVCSAVAVQFASGKQGCGFVSA